MNLLIFNYKQYNLLQTGIKQLQFNQIKIIFACLMPFSVLVQV